MLFGIDSTYFWLGLAVLLAALELSTATLVCIWFVIGALFSFGISFITDSLAVQMAVFVIVSGISLAVTRPMVKKIIGAKPQPTNRDLLIGSLCTVTEDILPGRKGRVKVGDVNWLARCDTPLKKGDSAKIHSIAGATITVTPAEEFIKQ